MDENEPIVPLQQVMDSVDDYGDPNWEPEPVDAGPGRWFICLPPFFFLVVEFRFTRLNLSCVFSLSLHLGHVFLLDLIVFTLLDLFFLFHFRHVLHPTCSRSSHSAPSNPFYSFDCVLSSSRQLSCPLAHFAFSPSPTEFRTNKPSDVISTLVSIYDSKDLFVKELQVLLAQRLLAIKDGNFERVEKEVSSLLHPFVVDNELTLLPSNQRRNIEILKIRFGEAALQVCEVMLKDMTDSKRIDGHVQSQKAVCCTTLSPKVGS